MYQLDYSSSVPIYQQIIDETKRGLLKGYFSQGDKLPSIREMAKTLLINESTVSKAYREMEAIGLIETVVGRGSFISLDREKLKERKESYYTTLRMTFLEALYLGYTETEIISILHKAQEEVNR